MNELEKLRIKVKNLEKELEQIYQSQKFNLSPTENAIFEIIKQASEDEPVSAKTIAKKLGMKFDLAQKRNLVVIISNLRKKIFKIGEIESIRCKGYYFIKNN